METAAIPSTDQKQRIRRQLLGWFLRHRRDLPWRHDRDPYRIWVSEVMLQQTQVATVVPYFRRFLQAFPTLADLAAAREQEVLKRWEGLGYYRRARDLHDAAQELVASHAGQLPDDPAVWRRLRGVGRYILGAVLSQAFDRRLPIVEANSQRVLCRLFGQRADPRRGPTRRWLWQAAEQLLPLRRVGDFNQALMELGALVCTAAAPKCADCPLRRDCVARRLGLQERIPPRPAGRDIVEVNESAVVIRRGKQVLLVQRPTRGRWANLWEFPHGPLIDGESFENAAARLVKELTGLDAEVAERLLTIRHSVTHHRITLACFAARFRTGTFRSSFYVERHWLPPSRLKEYPVSAPQRRLARQLADPARERCDE